MSDWTTTQLRNLRPGQSLTFYRGDLEGDLFRAIAGAPTCAALLRGLRRCVEELEDSGRIKVTKRAIPVPDRHGWPAALKRLDQLVITEYVAIGC